MLPSLQPLLLVYSGFQLLPGLGLGGCKCPGIYPFLPGLLVYVIELVVVISDGGFYFCEICGDIPFVIFLLHLFDSSLFSFLLLWLVVYFVDLFKKPAPGFIDFLKSYFVSISFGFALILVISCLLLGFECF